MLPWGGMRMRRRYASTLVCAMAAVWAVAACDRATEPFDPDEQPQQPDLSRIFPAGAERAAPPAVAPPAPGGSRGAPPVASSEHPVRGTVTVAGHLADRIPAGATLFLIARGGTPGPPLAVQRIASPRFPMEFSIGPEDRMIAGIPFSGPLRVTARIDSDGNATTRSPGDLQGAVVGTVDPGDRGVSLVIDEIL